MYFMPNNRHTDSCENPEMCTEVRQSFTKIPFDAKSLKSQDYWISLQDWSEWLFDVSATKQFKQITSYGH